MLTNHRDLRADISLLAPTRSHGLTSHWNMSGCGSSFMRLPAIFKQLQLLDRIKKQRKVYWVREEKIIYMVVHWNKRHDWQLKRFDFDIFRNKIWNPCAKNKENMLHIDRHSVKLSLVTWKWLHVFGYLTVVTCHWLPDSG